MSSVSPNMNLTIPDPQSTPGPTYAQELQTALEDIDAHDHTSGNGVRITPAAININASLDMNGYALTETDSVQLENRSVDISDLGVYAKNGELFFWDASDNAVQLTSGGSIAGASGSFTGLSSPAAATYSSGSDIFIWTYDSGKHAQMANGDILLYPYDGSTAYTKAVTLKAPTALEANSSYSLTLPEALPSSVEWLNVDNSGVVNHASLSGTSNQVNVSQSATAITLSLPQNIHTSATPTFSAVLPGAGTVGSPSVRFSDDTDTGMYRSGTNAIGFSCAGAQVLALTTSGGTVTGDLTVSDDLAVTDDAAINGDLTVGGSVNIASGGAFKVTVVTGSIALNTVSTVFSGATVYGVFGWAEGGSSTWSIIQESSSGSGDVVFTDFASSSGNRGTTSTVKLFNSSVSTSRSYRLIVFHA
jgi:hypothetical protein